MKTEYREPVESHIGLYKLEGCEYYSRRYGHKIIQQRRPNRSGHVPTPAEAANRQRFAERYAGAHKPTTLK